MTRAQSPAEDLFRDVISQAVSSPLKQARFKKTALNYHRRHGETVQAVNIQLSSGCSWQEKQFYVNVGIAFDGLCRLSGCAVLEKPRVPEFDERGMRCRLEELFPDAPDRWSLIAGVEATKLQTSLSGIVICLIQEFDRIDTLVAYRAHPWFDRFRPLEKNAQILYLLNDFDGAWQEVKNLATFFSDRQNANRTEWWIETLKLSKLKSRL
jgi:hypothetical protein